jgi:hypothetical protein
MPLRDHFRPPTTKYGSWTSLHGMWPAILVQQLRKQLPPGFVSAPRVQLGPYFEIDIATLEKDDPSTSPGASVGNTGTTVTLAPPRPTWAIETDIPEEDEFAVEIYSADVERQLVAVIEIVSPANKDRPESRRAFVGKCAALLRKGVAVSIVDLVTIRHANLYSEMMTFIGHPDPTLGPEAPLIYASSTRWTPNESGDRARLAAWSCPMQVGEPLPTLPLWLTDTQSVSLDLERCYESACEDLSIP